MIEKGYVMIDGAAAAGQMLGSNLKIDHNPTIRQNLDQRIAMHRAAITRLEATKAKMEASNLLDVPIGDLREAMNY